MQPEDIPLCDFDDPAALEAWWGRNQLAEQWRKCVLALCRDLERAKFEAAGVRYTVDKVDDRARQNPIYTDYLLHCLQGARLREQAWRDAASGSYGR